MTVLSPRAHSFKTIFGHDLLKRYLTAANQRNVLPHALLFSGPAGVGKTSMAFALAKGLNCTKALNAACTCESCRKITEGIHADVLVVGPRGAAGQITLTGWRPGDDPDGLQYYRFVDSRPLEGRKKVLIISEAERMNVPLANYLLKMIEEPPTYLQIVLVTHRPGTLLITIRSRCAPVRFHPLPYPAMKQFAETLDLTIPAAEQEGTLRLATGRPGLLMQLAAGTIGGRQKEVTRILRTFQQHGFLYLFRAASDLLRITATKGGGQEQFDQILGHLETWFRDALVLRCSPNGGDRLMLHKDLQDEVRAYSESVSVESLSMAAEAVRKAYAYLPRQVDKAYVIEMLLMTIGKGMKRQAS